MYRAQLAANARTVGEDIAHSVFCALQREENEMAGAAVRRLVAAASQVVNAHSDSQSQEIGNAVSPSYSRSSLSLHSSWESRASRVDGSAALAPPLVPAAGVAQRKVDGSEYQSAGMESDEADLRLDKSDRLPDKRKSKFSPLQKNTNSNGLGLGLGCARGIRA